MINISEEKKKLILTFFVIILFLLLLILIIWWIFRPKAEPIISDRDSDIDVISGFPIEKPSSLQSLEEPRIVQEKIYPLELKQLAMSFAERFVSYSSDEPNKNILDLEPFMTKELFNRLKSNDSSGDNDSFIGFSGRALTYELVKSNDLSAEIIVGVQLTSFLNDFQQTSIRNLEIRAKKVNNEWKIDDIK